MSPSRILVAYYSRTGHTAQVAQEVARALGADLEEIVDTRPRRGILGYLRAGYEARRGRPTVLGQLKRDPAVYDLVVLGTPVWNGSVSCAVRTYIEHRRGSLRQVAFFLTMGGSGKRRVFDQMEGLCHRAPIAVLAVREAQLKTGALQALVAAFVDDIKRARAPTEAHTTAA